MSRLSWFFIIVVLVGGGVFAKYFLMAPKVMAVKTESREVIELLIATGRLAAHRSSNLGFEVGGVLAERLVEEGNKVVAGQLLARLDNTEILAQVAKSEVAVAVAARDLDRAKRPALTEDLDRLRAIGDSARASTKQAQLELKRADQLGEYGKVADRDSALTHLDQARATEKQIEAELARLARLPLIEDVALAEAQLANVKANLALTKVQASRRELRAPYDGIIVTRFADAGVAVPIGSPIVRLAEVSQSEILVDTDEGNLGRLKIGQNATVTAQGFPGKVFNATLDRIGPAIDSQRGVVPLRLIPKNIPEWAQLEMTVDICIETDRFANAITLPPSAVIEKEGKAWVVLEVDGLVKFHTIKIRGRGREGIAIEGLEKDVRVAFNASGLIEGNKINLVDKSL